MHRISVSLLFIFGSLLLMLEGISTRLLFGNSPLDIITHDSYYKIAHIYVVAAARLLMIVFSGIYRVFSNIFRRSMNRRAGLIHFGITFLTMAIIFWPAHYSSGIAGAPRRYYDYTASSDAARFIAANTFISVMVILCVTAQLIFAMNFLLSIFIGRKT